ncbi:hypothetical protein ACQZV8_04260 [Magnetococcales bacterium HHB-1]
MKQNQKTVIWDTMAITLIIAGFIEGMAASFAIWAFSENLLLAIGSGLAFFVFTFLLVYFSFLGVYIIAPHKNRLTFLMRRQVVISSIKQIKQGENNQQSSSIWGNYTLELTTKIDKTIILKFQRKSAMIQCQDVLKTLV